jgi:sigma-B regulation protein RsbQ
MDAAVRPQQLRAGPVTARLNVTSTGCPDGPVVLFAHGFGCDQGMWDGVLPYFTADHRVIRYDLMGAGRSDTSAYDPQRYATLDGHAADILAVCAELDLHDVTLVAHSVSTMMAVLAAIAEPERFRQLVLVAASPYFLDDPATGYTGGFSAEDLAEVAAALDSNYFTWAAAFAPVIMGTPDTPELGEQLTASFCRADAMVPSTVADHLHDHLPDSTLVRMQAIGHCPHISAPEETAAAIRAHLPTSR